MNENLLIIFTRNPELGKVKTRLARTVGDQAALDIYKFLLNYTVKITTDLPIDKAVYYSEHLGKNDIWDPAVYTKEIQKGDDLGVRMNTAFEKAFAMGYKKVMVIGSDMFEIQSKHILEAFEMMDTHEVVIGPAKDGGYYLLGMTRLYKNAFQKKAWGTETVLKDTLNDLDHVEVGLLKEVLNDVDLYEDIAGIAAFEPFLKNITI